MDNKLKMAGLLAAGYLLGRTKKLKLALTVASSVAGVAGYSKREMFSEAISKISENTPELQVLTDKITGRLVDSGKSAAYSMVTMGVDQVSQKLQERIDRINDSLDSPAQTSPESAEDEAAEEGEPAEAEAQEEPAEDDEAAASEAEEPAETEEEPAEEEEQEPAQKEEKAPEKKTSAGQRTSSSGSRAETLSKGEARKIREWARENDIQVSSRGRIRKDVVQAYRDATEE